MEGGSETSVTVSSRFETIELKQSETYNRTETAKNE